MNGHSPGNGRWTIAGASILLATDGGRSRAHLQAKQRLLGSIELIGWDELIEDARARNQAFFDHAGISGKSFFSAE